jgi:NAD(P)-dependent dehydrogenase (short-subunit alcohol dehydrogenase family)
MAVLDLTGKVEKEIGGVDILVNNAGIPNAMALAAFRDQQPEQWAPYFAVNAYGPLNLAYAVLPHMRARLGTNHHDLQRCLLRDCDRHPGAAGRVGFRWNWTGRSTTSPASPWSQVGQHGPDPAVGVVIVGRRPQLGEDRGGVPSALPHPP